jgi:DNA-binding CsgD family transcriptional regulator
VCLKADTTKGSEATFNVEADRSEAVLDWRGSRGPLVERTYELRILGEAVAAAAEGNPGLAVIHGPAGIGKTRLLTEAKRLARDAGARPLAAHGSELESEFAFGVVRQLFEGVVDAEGSQPLDQAGAKSEDTSFATLHSLYWLTVNLAADSPLVIAVDDLHWCDEPSLRFLNYLVRRLDGLGVTLICTVRSSDGNTRSPLLAEILAGPLTASVRPRPLSSEATARLVGDHLGESPDQTFSAACHTATGGNPLLLGELISTLQLEGVAPDSGSVSAVTDLGPGAVSRAVLVRLGRLTDDALRLARAASVVGAEADASLLAAVAELDPDSAAAAAGGLVAAEILSSEPGAAFVHPLVGAAVYEDMPLYDRALSHERAAGFLHERGAPAITIAVHLMLAPARGHEWVCEVLAEAARESVRAGSPESAVHYLKRALAEPPQADRRAEILIELGQAEAAVDAEAAIEHLAEAFELSTDANARGLVAVTLARTLLYTDQPEEALVLIRRASAKMQPDSDDRLALEALELMTPVFGTGRPPPTDRLVRRLAPGASAGAKMVAAVASRVWAYAGGSAGDCANLAFDALDGGDLIAADNVFLSVTAILTLVRADRPEADDAWEALLNENRMRGSLASKAGYSLWRGYALLRRGELDDAEESLDDAREEFRFLRSGGVASAHHAGFLSAVLRERGDLEGARRALESVEARGDTSDAARYWLDALAQLYIAEERFDEAFVVAEDMERRFAFLTNPFDAPSRSHKAVAAYHLGRREEGLELAAESLELARRWGAPGTVGRALRVLGTLEREEGLVHLSEAVEISEGSVARLEHAKALVAMGSSLRRFRRPTDAREPLRRGLELADLLGAEALVAEARHELHAAGARPRTKALTGPASLTPAEHRVTERAAAGQTNRAIAEALFVTTKTVELHLSNAYRKLGVKSRRELPGVLGDPA